MKTDLPKTIYVGRVRNDKIVAFNAIYSDEQKYVRADIVNLAYYLKAALGFWVASSAWMIASDCTNNVNINLPLKIISLFLVITALVLSIISNIKENQI